MPELEQVALQESKGKVLDVGAGAGSHALWLQENGLEVTALDISEKLVRSYEKPGVWKRQLQADFWQIQPFGKFDTVLLLMNGIGLAGSLEQLPAFFWKN
jgi:2-polyprenyl-3-methyl-5-hydroxy-6-metoxy-1,4-benzoquinol methylase